MALFDVGDKLILDGEHRVTVVEIGDDGLWITETLYKVRIDDSCGYSYVPESRLERRDYYEKLCECGGKIVHPNSHSYWCPAYKR